MDMITSRPVPVLMRRSARTAPCGNCGGRGWKYLDLRRSEEAVGDAGERALLRRARTECLVCGGTGRAA